MNETIKYDACDENSWDLIQGKYPLSNGTSPKLLYSQIKNIVLLQTNAHQSLDTSHLRTLACGQLGQSYQDYHCPEHEKHMECPVDKNMEITATTHAKVSSRYTRSFRCCSIAVRSIQLPLLS